REAVFTWEAAFVWDWEAALIWKASLVRKREAALVRETALIGERETALVGESSLVREGEAALVFGRLLVRRFFGRLREVLELAAGLQIGQHRRLVAENQCLRIGDMDEKRTGRRRLQLPHIGGNANRRPGQVIEVSVRLGCLVIAQAVD